MSEAKPTPGPWTTARALTPTDGEFDFAIGAMIDGKKYCIAETFGRVSTGIRTPAEANARLIAASPAMFDFIKKRASEGDADAAAIIAAVTGRDRNDSR